MKILLMNQTFFPDQASTAQHLLDLGLELTDRGHQVTALSGRRSYLDHQNCLSRSEEYRGIKIIRVCPFIFRQKSKISRILNAVILNVSFAFRLLLMPRFDKVVVLTSPPLIAFAAAAISYIKRFEIVYWVMDLNPDQAIAAGWISEHSLKGRALKLMLRIVLKTSKKIIVLDKFMYERILSKGACKTKISIIPPWPVNESFINTSPDENVFRAKHALSGKFVVMYSGNHSICHPLDTMLEAAKLLRHHHSIVFVFIGGGERVTDVARFVEVNSLTNVMQLGYQEREMLKYSLTAADLHIVTMGTPYVGIIHPCKVYGILQARRPYVYIGPKESHISDLIRHYHVGEQIDHGNFERLVEIIENQEVRGSCLENSDLYEQVLNRFSKNRLVSDMISSIG